eukprot:355656-Chlamydomonas_euryale.AAC.3
MHPAVCWHCCRMRTRTAPNSRPFSVCFLYMFGHGCGCHSAHASADVAADTAKPRPALTWLRTPQSPGQR